MSVENRIALLTQIKDFLVTQGKPSANEEGDCLYRGPEDLKCAVGCIIPDELYKESFENCSVDHNHLEDLVKELSNLYDIPLYKLIEDLRVAQSIHDSYDSYDFNPKKLSFSDFINKEFDSYIKSIK